MTGKRFFRRPRGAESRTRLVYWTSKDHLLFEELTISAIVERREYSSQDRWVVVIEKTYSQCTKRFD